MESKNQRVYHMHFAKIYPLYVLKAEKKGRTADEVDQVICWLTGYNVGEVHEIVQTNTTLEQFFEQAPAMNENRRLITGSICGIKVQDIPEPLMQEIRYMDKLVDELAEGRPLDKILRS